MTVSITMNRDKADKAIIGALHTLSLDANFALVANNGKTKDNHPDFKIMAASPSGYPVEIGAVWERVGRESGNEYLSLQFNINGQLIRANGFEDDDGTFNVIQQDG